MSEQIDVIATGRPSDALEGELFAAIDLGSNSFHLVIARYERGTLHVIDRLKESVRLGDGVNSEGLLDDTIAERARQCLARFGERLRQIPPKRLVVVGTNALRRIRDDWRFLAEAEAALSHPIEIISGEEEARLIYLGVAHGIAEDGQQRLVIDIGGGSTEFAIGRDFHAIRVESLFFGCLSIAKRFFTDGKISPKRWQKARTAVAIELQRIVDDFRALGWQQVFGSSGTMQAVRDVVVANGWSERGITADSIARLSKEITARKHVEALTLAGLAERRQHIFPSGVVIVEAIFQALRLEQILVADYALREGLLYELIGRILHPDPRHGAVAALTQRYRLDLQQASRVQHTAQYLLGRIEGAWNLPEAAADWLGWAASLHEIGLTIAHHGYHRHGAYLLQNSDLPGFSRQEQALLSAMVRNHRRKPSLEAFDQIIARLREPAFRVTALLRLAVLLNRARSTAEQPEIKFTHNIRGLTMTFPKGWLNRHPLTQADLEEETDHLQLLGISLKYS